MKNYIPIFLLLIINTFNSFSQTTESKPNLLKCPVSSVTSLLDEKLDSIAVRNKKIKFSQGYRIIVYSGSNKEEINKIREKIYSIYPDVDIYQVYKQPDYKIKVGDYINRFEAHYALSQLKTLFPDALITMEQVNIVRPQSGQ